MVKDTLASPLGSYTKPDTEMSHNFTKQQFPVGTIVEKVGEVSASWIYVIMTVFFS